jgi:transcriptional regulator with XRE-family HTH domain
MSATSVSAGQFGARLREWRRMRGVSQLELAGRAATTSRHISFLETGRSRPRAEMVRRLAAALELLPREHNAMLEAAGLPAMFSQRSLDDAELERYRAAIASQLQRHEPLPAAVVDRYGAVRSANRAFERLTPGLVGLEPEELIERFFGPGPWRDTVMNWADVAGAWLSRQRLEAQRTGDPRLEELLTKAERLIGPLPRQTGTDSLPVACARLKVGDDILEIFTMVVRFDAASDVTLSELRVELMYPANEAADRYFRDASRRT